MKDKIKQLSDENETLRDHCNHVDTALQVMLHLAVPVTVRCMHACRH
jgi:hypothetical protein